MRWLVAVAVLVLSSGCIRGPDGRDASPDADAPGDVGASAATGVPASPPATPAGRKPLNFSGDPAQPPAWSVGDRWDYTYAPYGLWINHTVEAIEQRGGFQSYRVGITYEPPSSHWSGDIVPSTVWLDVQTLGFVGDRSNGFGSTSASCPLGRVFPLQDQTYECRISMGGFSDSVNVTTRFRGWEWQDTPAGRFWAANITYEQMRSSYGGMVDENGDPILPPPLLYAPDVGNLLSFEGGVCDEENFCPEVPFLLARASRA